MTKEAGSGCVGVSGSAWFADHYVGIASLVPDPRSAEHKQYSEG